MFDWIFGNKEMFDMEVYWDDKVEMEDLMDDLNRIGQYMTRTEAFKAGSRIVTVRNGFVDDALYKMAELYVDKKTEEWIRKDSTEGRFKAVKFVITNMTRKEKN